MAVADASFKTSNDSISLVFKVDSGLFSAELPTSPVNEVTPSIIINGYELKVIELVPRILNTGAPFNEPLEDVIFTPGAWPANAWSKLATGLFSKSLPPTWADEPVNSARFCTV